MFEQQSFYSLSIKLISVHGFALGRSFGKVELNDSPALKAQYSINPVRVCFPVCPQRLNAKKFGMRLNEMTDFKVKFEHKLLAALKEFFTCG